MAVSIRELLLQKKRSVQAIRIGEMTLYTGFVSVREILTVNDRIRESGLEGMSLTVAYGLCEAEGQRVFNPDEPSDLNQIAELFSHEELENLADTILERNGLSTKRSQEAKKENTPAATNPPIPANSIPN